MHVVIFAGGDCFDSSLVRSTIQAANFIIAADSGAASALQLGVLPNVVIGDFDSLKPSLQKKLTKQNVQLIAFKKEKDETDTELAINYAKEIGATKITILGGLSGNRVDHVITTMLLSFGSFIPLEFVNENQHISVASGPTTVFLNGKKGDLLSLIPLQQDVFGMTTENLQYPLSSETLIFGKSRGISNVFMKKNAKITFAKGSLLIVHTII